MTASNQQPSHITHDPIALMLEILADEETNNV